MSKLDHLVTFLLNSSNWIALEILQLNLTSIDSGHLQRWHNYTFLLAWMIKKPIWPCVLLRWVPSMWQMRSFMWPCRWLSPTLAITCSLDFFPSWLFGDRVAGRELKIWLKMKWVWGLALLWVKPVPIALASHMGAGSNLDTWWLNQWTEDLSISLSSSM